MDKLMRSTTVVTRLVIILIVFSVSLVVSLESSPTVQEDNYHRVSCDFESELCGWTNLPGALWTKRRRCVQKSLWRWSGCAKYTHYRQLVMAQLEENDNSTLISPILVPRADARCRLSFLYRYDCDSDACQLSVERQTHTGIEQLWNVTTYTENVETACVEVPCSDIEYKILIVGKKLANTECRFLAVDNIEFSLTTISATPEGSTFSSLSRRMSITSYTSLEATSASSSTPDGTDSFTITPLSTTNSSETEPMPNPDKQSSDDDGLGTGPVVAIVIVIVIVVVVVVIVVIVVIVVRRRNGAKKHNRTSGTAGSTSPGNSNLGGIEGHDNLVYSANRLEMDTIPPMSGHAANPENTPDYYNVLRLNSPGTGSSAPAQNDLYENTRSPPPDEEYAVVNKNGKKKQDPQPEDEYALPNKDQKKKKKKREKQAGQGQQKNNIPTENKTKKGRKTDQQANPSAFNSNAAGRSTQAEEAAAAGTSDDYEPVAGDSGMATSRPEQPSDMYNKLGDKERAGMQLDSPQTHYDHISAPYGDYSGMNLEDQIRDQQREAVADQYSHI